MLATYYVWARRTELMESVWPVPLPLNTYSVGMYRQTYGQIDKLIPVGPDNLL